MGAERFPADDVQSAVAVLAQRLIFQVEDRPIVLRAGVQDVDRCATRGESVNSIPSARELNPPAPV